MNGGVGVFSDKKQMHVLLDAHEFELTDVLRVLAGARDDKANRARLCWSWVAVTPAPFWRGLTLRELRRKAHPVEVEGVLEPEPPFRLRNDEASELKLGEMVVLLGTRARLQRFFQQAG